MVIMVILVAVTVASIGGISIIAPTFAQGGNMTDGGNYTEGNMTGTDMAGSGVASASSNDALADVCTSLHSFTYFLTYF